MSINLMDHIGNLMGLRYKSHPWHGVGIGKQAPEVVNCFIEVVPTDTVKYEVDKISGYLKIDRPQKYSSMVPALYGFIPQTFSGEAVGKYCSEKVKRDIKGDSDPLDICVLTEKDITHGDIICTVKPIGGFRMLDGEMADDKIIAVLNEDIVYGHIDDISELPAYVLQRLEHYFLTYKDMPGQARETEITEAYNREEARKIIQLSMDDYDKRFEHIDDSIMQE